MAQQQIQKENRSVGELISELANETGTLIRQEITLAQTEMTQKAVSIGTDIGYLAFGGILALPALGALVAAAIIGLSYLVPLWLSALSVGIVLSIAAGLIISSALTKLKETKLKPQETIKSLKEDAQWLKEQM
jgi:Na+(H+)/acetate symporter ActP